MRDLEILAKAIERRKGEKGMSYLDDGEEVSSAKAVEDMAAELSGQSDDGMVEVREDQMGDIPDDEDIDDGLAPKTMKEAMKETEDDDQWDDPEKVLGRKPMSTVSGKKNRKVGRNEDLDEDSLAVMDDMSDKRLQEQLKAGRKPSRLRDKVQLNIMEMQNNKK